MRDDSEAPTARTPFRLTHLRLSLADVVVIMMIVGLLIVLAVPSGDQDGHRFPPPGPNPGTGFADVAGEYYQGALGRYWSLRVLADGRYSFMWLNCSGVHRRESGFVSRVSDDIALLPIKPNDLRIDRTFRPVRWGRRSYLIPPGRMQEFCDAIIRGDEPRNGPAGKFYLLGDKDKVSGMPELPEQWAAYLQKNIVIGTTLENHLRR